LIALIVACSGGGSGQPTLPSFPNEAMVEISSFNLINQDRQQHGVRQLKLDARLSAMARAHSEDMRNRNYLGHTTLDGKTLSDRLKGAGISAHGEGENIAQTVNNLDPATLANILFLNDPAHRGNLLDRQFTLVGIGVARSGDTYWITQDYIQP